jgi:hypothetical protein
VSWHTPDDEPVGAPHGAAGVCIGPEGELVLVIEHRLVVPAALGARYVRYPDEGATRIHLRALVEAGLEP